MATNSRLSHHRVCDHACAGDSWTCSPREWERRSSGPQKKSQAADDRKFADRNRVLMLGSNRELALYRAEVLQQHGFHVQISTNRAQALDLIRAGNYDVVVLSYTLPDAVVREFADEMREHGRKPL